MANVTKFPTTAQSVQYSNSISWTNIDNIKADDGSFASVTLANDEYSYSARSSNFNFGISPLATIEGLVVSIERYASLANVISDYSIYLSIGSLILTPNQSNSAYWSTTNSVVTFGSPSDLWDRSHGISVNILNNMDVNLVCRNTGGYSTATAYIDYVKATVYYSIDGVKFSSSSLADIRDGSTQIQRIYHGSNQVFPDDDPNSIAWSNVSSSTSPVTSSTQTFTGLNTSIPIRLTRSVGGGTTSYILNGGSPVAFPFPGASISISNNDTLSFTYANAKASTVAINVYHENKLNGTNNYQLLDQLTLQKT
jgi:hypothetical protein